MKFFSRLRRLLRPKTAEGAWEGETPAWLVSFMVHVAILSSVVLVGGAVEHHREIVTLLTAPAEREEDKLTTSDEFSYSPTPQEQIGSSSATSGDAVMSAAPSLAMSVAAPSQLEAVEQPRGIEPIRIQDEIQFATAPQFSENLMIKGAAGVGATGATGAVDRITQEILQSLEQKRTLVVWLFDQSGSLELQRKEINKRFDRIYEELGVIEAAGNPAFKKYEDKPLLTAVMAFGEKISLLTPKPTDDVDAIKKAIAGMKTDPSGIERTFEAVTEAAEKFRTYRSQGRNVMFIILTDEVGDDEKEVDGAVAICRKNGIPVYCIGVPAPFGRVDVEIKYVDPDPKFDQTPQWPKVRQGPESCRLELVQFADQLAEPMDSGFGPYALERLCYETGGICFAVHPNRNEQRSVSRHETAKLSAHLDRFFDDNDMRRYRPEYVSNREYQKLVNENKACKALVDAAQLPSFKLLLRPELFFPKRSDADLVKRMAEAQHPAAELERKIDLIYDTLKTGEKDRQRLTRPRWKAGYDLSMGMVMAEKARTNGYNLMLAKGRTMRFQDPKSDTWNLVGSDEFTVGSNIEKLAREAEVYLRRVVEENPKTPWGLLAEKELKQPMGWTWKEMNTGVNNPERKVAAKNNVVNNNVRRTPPNEKAQMIQRPTKRPVPKL